MRRDAAVDGFMSWCGEGAGFMCAVWITSATWVGTEDIVGECEVGFWCVYFVDGGVVRV